MDPEFVVLVVTIANAIVLALGGVIVHLAYRAYRRTRRASMRRFAIGFGLVTLGFLAGGGVHQLAGTDVLVGVLVQSNLTMIGFAVLAYSLYATDRERPGPRVPASDP